MQNQGAQGQTPQQPQIPQVTLGPPMGTTYFTNMYHTGGPVSATLQPNMEAATQPIEMETPVAMVMQQEVGQMTSQMLVPSQQPQPIGNNQSGQCSPSSDSNNSLVSYGSNHGFNHQEASESSVSSQKVDSVQDITKSCVANQQKDKHGSKTGESEVTNKKLLPGKPNWLSFESTKEAVRNNSVNESAQLSSAAAGKDQSEGSNKTVSKECVTSPKINLMSSLGECTGDVDGGGYQDSGCVSDVSSGVGENLCSVLPPDDSTLSSEPQSPVGLLLEETDERSLLRSAHNSESSDTHSDSSSQHSLSNISSISTQSDVSVPSNKIMRAHTAKKGKYGVGANAYLVRPLKDFPPRFQKIISQNPGICSEKFEGPALIRHNRQNKHLVVPHSPSTTDTSLSSSDEASHQTHQFNPNAQSFVPHQNNYVPQTNNGAVSAQPVTQDQSAYYSGFDPNVNPAAANVGVVNGSYMSLAPPNANYPTAPAQNVPAVSGDGNVMYTDGSVCCGEGEEGEGKAGMYYQPAPYQNAPTYTIHIINVPPSGSGAQPAEIVSAAGQMNGTTPASPTACANTSALSSNSVGYQVPQGGGGDGMVYASQQPSAAQYHPQGTVYYTNPPASFVPQQTGGGAPPEQQYNPYMSFPAPANMVPGQVQMVAQVPSGSSAGSVIPPGSVVYSHPPPTSAMSVSSPQQQQVSQQQQQAAAAQFASMPPPPPPGAATVAGPASSVQPTTTQYNSQPSANGQQVFSYNT